jgi:CRP/FNR family transcriptional regulator, cyclic AMP receptor protein
MNQTPDRSAPLAPARFSGTRSPASVLRRVGDRPAPVWSLTGMPLFDGLDEATSQRLDEVSRWARFQAGEMILDPEDRRREVFFVAEGRVRVVNYASTGREVVHASLGPGEYFGELAILGDQPRTAAVWAIEDSMIAMLPPEEVLALLQNNSAIALRMLERLAHVIRQADERIGELTETTLL